MEGWGKGGAAWNAKNGNKGGTLPLKESMLLFSRIMGIVGLKEMKP